MNKIGNSVTFLSDILSDVKINDQTNYQSLFLKKASEEKLAIELFLINGIRLKTPVLNKDDAFILGMDMSGNVSLITRHSVSSCLIKDSSIKIKASLSDFKFESKNPLFQFLEKNGKKEVSIYLLTGTELKGRIVAANTKGVLLYSDKVAQSINFDAITSITESKKR